MTSSNVIPYYLTFVDLSHVQDLYTFEACEICICRFVRYVDLHESSLKCSLYLQPCLSKLPLYL